MFILVYSYLWPTCKSEMFIPRMPFCCKQQRQLKLRTCRRLVRLTGLLAGYCQHTTRQERRWSYQRLWRASSGELPVVRGLRRTWGQQPLVSTALLQVGTLREVLSQASSASSSTWSASSSVWLESSLSPDTPSSARWTVNTINQKQYTFCIRCVYVSCVS